MMDNKYKIVALFGEAGAGKDYIQKQIMETNFGKRNLSEIISCTTRPPREKEIDGVHYHFIPTAAELFDNISRFVELTSFREWFYGTSIDNLNAGRINIGVFNIAGIQQLLKNKNVECLPLRIYCPDKIRLLRQLTRESNPDCDEIIRRYLADSKDFLTIPFRHKVIENDTNEIMPVLNDIEEAIIEEWSK